VSCGLLKAGRDPIADGIVAPREVCGCRDRQASESDTGEAIADPGPKQAHYPLCRLLILLGKNLAFGSFPLPPYLGTFRKLLWAFFRKLLGASYAVPRYPL
jgi:hypothetical protein